MSEIRDPIYGFIKPTEEEFKIIDTSIFQRLRRIRQLACAYLVYPGALHTRFEHSLGVMYLVSAMVDNFNKFKEEIDDEQKRILKLAALLHDIGHGPFSHVSEDILELFTPDEVLAQIKKASGGNVEKIHEEITFKLIENNSELRKIINEADRKEIIRILSDNTHQGNLLKQIISGPIDADKQDYLLRDSYYCGVKYGVYDYHRLINTLDIFDDSGFKYIVFSEDGINSLEQFFLAKYFMTSQVYRHRVRLITDQMIVRGILLGIEKDKDEVLRKLYIYEDTEDYFTNYLNWWDDKLINYLITIDQAKLSHQIFERIYKRNLLKRIFSIDTENIISIKRSKLEKITKKENKVKRIELEEKIAHIIGTNEKEFVILHSYNVKSVKEMSKDGESEDQIHIKNSDKGLEVFHRESLIFNSIDETMKKTYLEVYAPVTLPIDKVKKEKQLKEWQKSIIELLNNN